MYRRELWRAAFQTSEEIRRYQKPSGQASCALWCDSWTHHHLRSSLPSTYTESQNEETIRQIQNVGPSLRKLASALQKLMLQTKGGKTILYFKRQDLTTNAIMGELWWNPGFKHTHKHKNNVLEKMRILNVN